MFSGQIFEFKQKTTQRLKSPAIQLLKEKQIKCKLVNDGRCQPIGSHCLIQCFVSDFFQIVILYELDANTGKNN